MKKRCFQPFLLLLMLLVFLVPAQAAGPAGTLTVRFYNETSQTYSSDTETDRVLLTVDGKSLTPTDIPALAYYPEGSGNGRTLIPVRLVSEALNADVQWVNETRQVIIRLDDDVIVLTLGSAVATVNGQQEELPSGVPAMGVVLPGSNAGSTMVPLRFVSEMLGAQVAWDNNTFTAAITTPVEEPEPQSPNPDLGKVLRIEQDDNAQSVFIATDHVPQYKVTDLGNRLVVDVLGTTISEGSGSITVENEVISTVRYAQHDDDLGYGYPHTVRVVLDLSNGYTYTDNISVQKQVGGILISSFHEDDGDDGQPEVAPPTPVVPIDPSAATVVIDPGHGGSASGAYYEGIMEKNITLPISLMLRDLLVDKGYNVVMTRDSDVYMTLSDRCQVANDINADVFISIHCNALENNTSYEGLFTFYSTGSSKGQKLAQYVQDATAAATGTINRGIRNNSDYTVLRKTNMPAILVETGFMSSHNELMNLCDSDYQMLLAQGMAEGIIQYLNQAG